MCLAVIVVIAVFFGEQNIFQKLGVVVVNSRALLFGLLTRENGGCRLIYDVLSELLLLLGCLVLVEVRHHRVYIGQPGLNHPVVLFSEKLLPIEHLTTLTDGLKKTTFIQRLPLLLLTRYFDDGQPVRA